MISTHMLAGERQTMRRRLIRSVALGLILSSVASLPNCSNQEPASVLFQRTADPVLRTTLKEGLFLTATRIGNREAGFFLLDTGASHLIVDVTTAERFVLPISGEREDRASGQRIRFGWLDSLGVGPATLHNTLFAVMDLSSLSELLGEPVAGILGYPFFAKIVVEIDYRNGRVRCFDPKLYGLTSGQWQVLTIDNDRPAVPARLEGDLEGTFWLDTGKSLSVSFLPDFIRQYGLLEGRQLREVRNVRLGEETQELEGTISWFELAGRRFERPTVRFKVPNSPGARSRRGIAGFIGQEFLREFIVVFNYPERRIAFLRHGT